MSRTSSVDLDTNVAYGEEYITYYYSRVLCIFIALDYTESC